MADAALPSPPRFHFSIALLCVLAGAGLFAGAVVALDTGYNGSSSPGMDPRLSFIATPLFLAPLCSAPCSL
jgi:hypothetical protein